MMELASIDMLEPSEQPFLQPADRAEGRLHAIVTPKDDGPLRAVMG